MTTVPPVPTFNVVEVITPAVICPEEFLISKLPTTVLKPVTVKLLVVTIPANLNIQRRIIVVPEEPTAPTVRLTSSRGLVVPIPTFRASFGEIPVPIPEGTAVNRESFERFVRPEPSPVNAVATIDPLNLDSPTIRSLNPFAVEPIPTPSLSAQTRDVPDPTFKFGVTSSCGCNSNSIKD